MTDIIQARIIIIALAVWLLISIGQLIWAFRKGDFKRLKYALKNNINSARILISTLASIYIVCGLVYVIRAVSDWVDIQPVSDSLIQNFLVQSFPLGIAVFTIIMVIVIMDKGIYPRIKYNDEELQWMKESDDKFNNSRIGKLFNNKVVSWLRRH